ncbi:MAG: metal ABC transporter ATP-binding protein [Steroidobacteraceae bacterium]
MTIPPEALAVEHLSVSLAGRTILDSVDFTLARGELCGLIGANGSGKTTLLRTILGFEKPSSGKIRIGPIAGTRGSSPVGYVPQKILLDSQLPLRARDVVALGLDARRLGLPLPSRARQARVEEMLDAVGAADFADQRVGNLSGGQQQRILVAHALVRRPALLLLDEPLASLDVRSAAEIVALLRHLCDTYHIAVLLSAHDVNPLLSVMDRVVYLAGGRAACGTTDEVVCAEVLSRLYGHPIDVVRLHGRIVVIASEAPEEMLAARARDSIHATRIA